MHVLRTRLDKHTEICLPLLGALQLAPDIDSDVSGADAVHRQRVAAGDLVPLVLGYVHNSPHKQGQGGLVCSTPQSSEQARVKLHTRMKATAHAYEGYCAQLQGAQTGCLASGALLLHI